MKAAVARLIAGLEAGCADAEVREQCLRFVKAARQAAKSGDGDTVIDQIDLFVLCLQRHLGTQIALQHAADLFEIAVTGLKTPFGQPAQILAEAQPFAERLVTLARLAGTPLLLRPRPAPPAKGLRATHNAIETAIRSYALPADAHAALLDSLSKMTSLALLDPAAVGSDEIVAFRAAASEFDSLLGGLEGSYITGTQRLHLSGLVIFSRTGAACVGLIPLILQILAVAAAATLIIIVFRGIKGMFRQAGAARKANSLNQFIVDSGTVPESIGPEVDRLTEGASREELVELRDFIEKVLREGGYTGGEEQRKAQAALDAVDAKLNQ